MFQSGATTECRNSRLDLGKGWDEMKKGLNSYVALLRGVNVGGKNRISMADLSALFVKAGCADVETYIQSGNVAFRADRALGDGIPLAIETALLKLKGLHAPVLARQAGELSEIARENPFLKEGTDPRELHVGFLALKPTQAQIALLDPKRSPPDEFRVRGKEIYFRFPKGLARTKLTNQYFDSRLGTVCTIRNWNTVMKLNEMAAGK